MQFSVRLDTLDATRQFGRALADAIEDRAIVALVGPIGAGKTTLVKAVAAGLGVQEIVNSPTFTMLNEYHSGRLPLYHMDLYRLMEEKVPAPLDLLLAEIEEFIEEDMVAMIEWAELLPASGGLQITGLLAGADGSDPSSDAIQIAPTGLFQLDHLVVNLSPKASGETPGSPREPISLGVSGEQSGLSHLSDGKMHINKDEDLRIATVQTCGRLSEELANRVLHSVTAMLIYS